jgi:hypothetical protein
VDRSVPIAAAVSRIALLAGYGLLARRVGWRR